MYIKIFNWFLRKSEKQKENHETINNQPLTEIKMDNNREYTNGEITVYWKPALCTHSTICFTSLPKVFNLGKRPWVNMEGATTENIIKIVNRCPTDALTFKYNNEIGAAEPKKTEEAAATNITIVKNGPYLLSGNFVIKDVDGKVLEKREKAALCRCGSTKIKPFCDGTHRKIEFKID